MIHVDRAAAARPQAAGPLEPGSPVAARAYFVSQASNFSIARWFLGVLGPQSCI